MGEPGGFLKAVRLDWDRMLPDTPDPYLRAIPAVAGLDELALDPAATFLVGDNGTGKSTLLEAIAVAADLNAEGGSRHFRFETRASQSNLYKALRLVRSHRRPATDFFLRAETLYNVATQVDQLGDTIIEHAYGGRSLHEQSHGESFLALALHRFEPNGFYVLDEPEAALSPQNQLALLVRIADLASRSSQFLIATHSPILLALPGATIYVLDAGGYHRAAYDELELVHLYRDFLAAPERYLRQLLAED